MQRRLILMRHAQSALRVGGGSDHERPLTESGRHDATRVARRLAELGWSPDAVLSSDSTRTRQTWEGMADALEGAPEPHFSRALYCAGPNDIWTEAHHLAPEVGTVLCLGHNPGWERAVYLLTSQAEQLTPANAVLLEGEGDAWPEALQQLWRLIAVVRPAELPD